MSSQKPKQFISLLSRFASNYKIKNNNWLEIGCGNGNVTYFLNEMGINTLGIDVEFKSGPNKELLLSEQKIKEISTQGNNRNSVSDEESLYSWPCLNESIEFSFSSSVLEHVINPKQFIKENFRTLVKGGYTIHYLPSKYALIEPHVGIPFGGFLINKIYFKIMCKLGLCFKQYRNNGKKAFEYMIFSTNYYSKKQLKSLFTRAGFEYIGEYSKFIPFYLGPKLTRWISLFPLLIFLFSIFRSHILIFKKQ